MKDHGSWTQKCQWKSCSTTHLQYLPFNPVILKAFPESFCNEMKPSKYPVKERNGDVRKGIEEWRRGSGRWKASPKTK